MHSVAQSAKRSKSASHDTGDCLPVSCPQDMILRDCPPCRGDAGSVNGLCNVCLVKVTFAPAAGCKAPPYEIIRTERRSSKRLPRFAFQKSAIRCRFLKVRLRKHPPGMFSPLRMTRTGWHAAGHKAPPYILKKFKKYATMMSETAADVVYMGEGHLERR